MCAEFVCVCDEKFRPTTWVTEKYLARRRVSATGHRPTNSSETTDRPTPTQRLPKKILRDLVRAVTEL
jgi:hypothetical protein